MRLRAFAVLLVAGFLQACMLTADRPLFAPADGDPAFVLREGLWAMRDPECTADPKRTTPRRKSCIEWLTVARAPDGAWLMRPLSEDDEVRGVFVAASPRHDGALSSVYAGEFTSSESDGPTYMVAAPRIGAEGLVEAFAYEIVPCSVTDAPHPPMPGIELQRDTEGRVSGCKATSQAAVLEAARRAALDALPEFGRHRLEFVRP